MAKTMTKEEATKIIICKTLELDDLWARGLGESDEAEALRDTMDYPWWHCDQDAFHRYFAELKAKGYDG